MGCKRIVVGLAMVGVLLGGYLVVESTVKPSKAWRLTGREILLELCGENEQFTHGIYALDPFSPDPKPRMLLRGARRPVWSPKRNFIAYIKNNRLWISDRNGNADLVETTSVFLSNLGFHDPPIVWTWKEGFFFVFRLSSWGGTVDYPVENPPEDGDWDAIASTIIPLKRRLSEDPKEWDVGWDDLLCFNNPTCSPDGKLVAAEVYPAGPEDLRRRESKILVYERCPPEEMELRWQFMRQTFRKEGRRLTNLGQEVTELKPLWSPTGEWIAFTVVNWKEGYVAPAVIRPDGKDYTELLSKEASLASISLGAQWEPVVPLDVKHRQPPISSHRWGQPDVWAEGWSEDGSFLLLNMGKRYEHLQVAKWDGKEWWVVGIGGRMTSGFGGFKFATFGVGRWLAAVPDIGPGGDEIWMAEVNPDDIRKGRWKTIVMPKGVCIEWMDW